MTVMTDQEWDAIASLLEHGWPGGFSEEAGDAYRVFLATRDAGAVLAALQRLVQRGGTFRPSAAEIVAALDPDPGRPTFEEAYAALFGPRGVVHARPDEAAMERAERVHPYLAAFVRVQGLDRLRTIGVDDPDYGAIERHRLREAWDRNVEACDGRVREGRALSALGQGGGDLRRLDPLAALYPDGGALPQLTGGDA